MSDLPLVLFRPFNFLRAFNLLQAQYVINRLSEMGVPGSGRVLGELGFPGSFQAPFVGDHPFSTRAVVPPAPGQVVPVGGDPDGDGDDSSSDNTSDSSGGEISSSSDDDGAGNGDEGDGDDSDDDEVPQEFVTSTVMTSTSLVSIDLHPFLMVLYAILFVLSLIAALLFFFAFRGVVIPPWIFAVLHSAEGPEGSA